MRKKGIVFGIVMVFLVGSFASGAKIEYVTQQSSRGNILYVGGSEPGNYSSIQAAINDANPGDTVFVYDDSSPYYENVIVDKSLNLIGENKDTTVIDGSGNGYVVHVSADSVKISGFTIQNSGTGYYDTGIEILSNFNTITGNSISNNDYGISLWYSSSNNITGNTITENNYDSISLWYSSSNTITGNNISSNNGDGVSLSSSSSNNIIGNIISNNDDGIGPYYSSNNNNITGNTISNNNDGIHLYSSSSNNIIENIISNNGDGIGLYSSSGNNIIENIISNNGDGISLWYSSSNTIIYHNNFINNTQNAYDECDNIWDDGEYGNYWDDYKEKYPDARKIWLKGIWDTPYEIPGGDNKDMCPLIKQWPNSLSRTIPRDKVIQNTPFLNFLQNHPNLFPILQRLLQRLGLQ